MWLTGNINLDRTKSFEYDGLNAKGKMQWIESNPYGTSLSTDPFRFAYALIRSSIIGSKINARQYIASSALALSSMAYMEKIKGSSSLHLHSSFSNNKDFVSTGYKGMIGSAFAYLDMTDSGYIWTGHWEDCVPPSISSIRDPRPDFVFSDEGNICIVDAKGSASSTVCSKIKSEWKKQIRPYLGQKLSLGGTISRGMVIATTLAHGNTSTLLRAKGELKRGMLPVAGHNTDDTEGTAEIVQRSNFVDVLRMIEEHDLANAIIGGPQSDASLEYAHVFQMQPTPALLYASYQLPILINSEIWTIRPFCRADAISDAIKKFILTDDTSKGSLTRFSEKITISEHQNNQENSNIKTYIIEAPDGAGALFQKFEAPDFTNHF
ncbi:MULTISPECIES: hypothetical protein [unclassified Pseudomonas]|uniref:hypothetical protein n=1 Tax=unclassified Pseudomonas TaxID=196821 RepID=UPI0012FD1810|nr:MULTISPECIES: hypothetical protein [unclassified Pseudomonas]MCU1738497.1 hypothetical protein [Pseudomonas sp. 20S_6.2_Bac1]